MGNYFSAQPTYKTYGWKPDIPDLRDHRIRFCQSHTEDVDLRSQCPSVYDQGNLGSCTAQAICFAYEFNQIRQHEESPFIPSRLFVYYNERDVDGNTNVDSGSSLRTASKVVASIGVCKEDEWPYNIDQFTEKPPEELYKEAMNHKSIRYKKVYQEEDQLKHALRMNYPIVFGIAVYESFEGIDTFHTGIVSMPKEDEKMVGGHAIALVGFDDEKKHFIFRNSWGTEWGENGYGYLPYEYVLNENLSSDFWIIEKVKDTI